MTIYAYYKCMFSSVSSGCCKSRFGCCIYMVLQEYVFECFRCCICMLQVFHLDVAYVFAMATHVFFKCFRRILQVFQLFRTYVASVSSRCCKSSSKVTHVAMGPTYCSRLLQLLGRRAYAWEAKGGWWQGAARAVPGT
jgi:hypothetical protein